MKANELRRKRKIDKIPVKRSSTYSCVLTLSGPKEETFHSSGISVERTVSQSDSAAVVEYLKVECLWVVSS